MQASVVGLERHWTFTALGIRFWDPVLDVQVRDALTVTARLESPLSRTVQAFPTASGLFAFQGLPGLRDVEFSPDGEFPASPPETHSYLVQASDRRGRFLPTAFRVDLPLPYRGVFLNGGSALAGSPPGQAPLGFYLFSAPTRLAAPGLAAVRADLRDFASGREAAHALLEVEVEGVRRLGLADERGQAAVLFPYPTFERRLPASPPVSADEPAPVVEQSWDAVVRVRYSPAAHEVLEGIETPELRSLFAQPQAMIRPDEFGPALGEWPVQLVFGKELQLRTADGSELLIEAAGSPP